jgi:ERF superfamily
MTATTAAPGTLLEAILAVQAEVGTLFKDKTATVPTKTGGQYQYRYIGLDTIVEQVGPILNRNGLVWMTFPSLDTQGRPALAYRLSHAPTEKHVEGEMPLMVDKPGPQGMGSALTYARRYSLCAVLNLVADEDDDAKAASVNLQSAGQLARARANMTDRAKALLVEADEVYSQGGGEEWLPAAKYAEYKDSTGYVEDGLRRLVDWLRANVPARAV